jgi:hypothetical protein
MDFFRRLFASKPSKPRGLYLYIKPKACNEIIEVRIDTMNELSRSDDESGFFVRKLARGNRCPFTVEIEVSLDSNHKVVEKQIINGTEVTEAEYQAFVASRQPNA